MATKQTQSKETQALERLTAKLTALRKTLRGDERKLLDSMVLSAQSEVTAHSKNFRLAGANAQQPAARQASDMQLHSANVRRLDVGAKASAAASRTAARTAAGAQEAKAAQAENRLAIDLRDGVYTVVVL